MNLSDQTVSKWQMFMSTYMRIHRNALFTLETLQERTEWFDQTRTTHNYLF